MVGEKSRTTPIISSAALCIWFRFFLLMTLVVFLGAFTLPPAGCSETSPAEPTAEEKSGQALLFPVKLFQQFISGADGDRCPMVPSCSAYCVHATKKHGPIIGFVMTCDRLLRCGRDEVRLSPPIVHGDAVYSHDSVDNNDFWWR
jgi:putative component of membrane protein insertase Oxa1/YidC/SpoIIIJ protein YidD